MKMSWGRLLGAIALLIVGLVILHKASTSIDHMTQAKAAQLQALDQ